MDIAQLLVTPLMVLFVSVVGGYVLKDRLDRIDARIDRVEARLDGRIDKLEARIDRLDAKLDAVRADLTQIALAVGAHLKPQTG